MPMRRMRSFSLGGLPSGSPSAPEVTPTRAHAGLPIDKIRPVVTSRAARSNETPRVAVQVAITPSMLALEAPAHPKHETVIFKRVVWHRRRAHETPTRQAEGRTIVERHGQHEVQNRIVLIAHRVGIDNNIRLIIYPPLLADRQIDGPGQAGFEQGIEETKREPAADAP